MNLLKLSPEADDISRNHFRGFSDWKAYRRDIRNNPSQRPPIGQARYLGCFTLVRDQQWSLSKDFTLQLGIDTISSHTRSHDKQGESAAPQPTEVTTDVAMGEDDATYHASTTDNPDSSTQAPHDGGDDGEHVRDQQWSLSNDFTLHRGVDPISLHTRSHATNQRDFTTTDPMEDTTDVTMKEDDATSHMSITDDPNSGTQPEYEQSSATDSFAHVDSSEQSVADQDEYPLSQGGEETVNMAAVSFLRVLSMQCPEAKL